MHAEHDYVYLSLLFAASLNGGTVIRPVFFEFPTDSNTTNLSHQFMWGPAVLVIPAVFEVCILSLHPILSRNLESAKQASKKYSIADYF